MKKVLLIIGSIILLSSCSKVIRLSDSEITAIRDQTEVIEKQIRVQEEQNRILQEISNKIK